MISSPGIGSQHFAYRTMISSIPVRETPKGSAFCSFFHGLLDGLFLLELLLRQEMMDDMLRRNPSVADDRHQVIEGIDMTLGKDAVHFL